MTALYIPEMPELWFRRQLLADEATMSYNRRWGGTVDFPEVRWPEWYERWLCDPEGHFYRYLTDESGAFVGEAAYHREGDIYMADVIVYAPYRRRGHGREGLLLLCDAAKKNGLEALHDRIAADNPAVKLFTDCGFSVTSKDSTAVTVMKRL